MDILIPVVIVAAIGLIAGVGLAVASAVFAVPVDEKAYTFTMPASAVKVTVEFEEGKDEPSVDPTPAEDKFADVADDFWAAKDIYTLKDAGIIGGKSATEFDPEGDVTRAEFAKIICVLLDLDVDKARDQGFKDIKGHWAADYINACAAEGLIEGKGNGRYDPDSEVKRSEVVTVINRITGAKAGTSCAYSDVDPKAWYFGAVAAAAKS